MASSRLLESVKILRELNATGARRVPDGAPTGFVFQAAGAGCLVVSGVVDTAEQIGYYTAAVAETPVTVCRLRAAPTQLTHRIGLRGWGGGPPIPGDELKSLPPETLAALAEDAISNARQLDQDAIGDVYVDTDGLAPAEVARLVLDRSGWPR